MLKKKRQIFLALFLSLAMIMPMLSACGSSPSNSDDTAKTNGAIDSTAEENTKQEITGSKQLSCYTSMAEEEIPVILGAFEEDTGIRINYVRLAAGEMFSRVRAEKDNPNATLLLSGSTDNYIEAAKEGVLEPYQSSELENIPDSYEDPDGFWNPYYIGVTCFACNSEWFEENGLEYPANWEDLLRPELEGEISLAHPSTSGASYVMLSGLTQMKGEEVVWDYLTKLNKNVRQYTKSSASPPMEAALGEAAVAVVYAHTALKQVNEGYPIEIVYPDDGTMYEVGAVGIMSNSSAEEQEYAKIFIDWLLSTRGQECLIESQSNVTPLNVDAKVSDGMASVEEISTIDYDAQWGGENRTRLVEEFMDRIDNASSLSD